MLSKARTVRTGCVFNGANINEKIDISANGDRVRLFRDVGVITMDFNDVEQLDVNALGGADTITINDLSGTDVTLINVGSGGDRWRWRRCGGLGYRQRNQR